jgi:hypothetical protein
LRFVGSVIPAFSASSAIAMTAFKVAAIASVGRMS